jgi:hypothetical protein
MSEYELRMAMPERQTKHGSGRRMLRVRGILRRTMVGPVEEYASESVAVILGCPCLHIQDAGG